MIMTRGGADGGFQEPPHELLRSATVSSTLDQDIENEAILIDGAPKPVLLAGDRDDDLIHMPFVAASRRALADLIGEGFAELPPPLAHGLVRHENPARRQHFLDHAKAQGKPEIEPDGIARSLPAESDGGDTEGHGKSTWSAFSLLANSQLVNVTMPIQRVLIIERDDLVGAEFLGPRQIVSSARPR